MRAAKRARFPPHISLTCNCYRLIQQYKKRRIEDTGTKCYQIVKEARQARRFEALTFTHCRVQMNASACALRTCGCPEPAS